MRVPMLPSAGFCFALLATASAAHACSGHGPPDSVSMIPGAGLYRPDMVLLLPILAGTLERPIYALAGYRFSTLGYSIQANLLASVASNVVGGLGFVLFWSSPAALGALLIAPVIAVLIKLAWFSRVPREDERANRIGWFILATTLSTVTIATIPMWMALLGTDRQSYAFRVADLRPLVIIAVALAAIATHARLFLTLQRGGAAADSRRGFDVMTPPATLEIARTLA